MEQDCAEKEISPPQGLPPEEDCQRPKTFAAFSPPKSLSDAGGGLCGLNEQYSFYLGTQTKLTLAQAAKSPPKAEDFAEEKRGEIEKLSRIVLQRCAAGSACAPMEQDCAEKEISPPHSLSNEMRRLCGWISSNKTN